MTANPAPSNRCEPPLKMLSPPEVARRLRIKADSVRQLIRSGELRAADLARPGSRRPRFRIEPADVELFLAGRAVRPPDKPTCRRRRKPTDVVEFF